MPLSRQTFVLTNGGTFIVEETGAGMVPGSLANFATSIACIDDDSQQASGATVIDGRMVTFTPTAGEHVTCTFINREIGSVTVRKDTTDSSTGTFNFRLVNTDFAIDSSFSLTGNGDVTAAMPVPGRSDSSYTLTETFRDGYTVEKIVCTNSGGVSVGTRNGNAIVFTVAPGEAVLCVVTNEPPTGTLTIEKLARGATRLFNFTSDGSTEVPDDSASAGVLLNGGFSITDDGSDANATGVTFVIPVPGAPRSVTVRETSPGGRWNPGPATCTDASGSPTGSPSTSQAAVTLSAGDVITCRFENIESGSITIDKVVTNGNGPQDLDFTFSGDLGDFALSADDAAMKVEPLTPQTRTVTETLPNPLDGWAVTGVAGAGCTGNVNITPTDVTFDIVLAPGEDITCTVTNKKAPTLEVVKQAPNLPGQQFDFGFAPRALTTPFVPVNPAFGFQLQDTEVQRFDAPFGDGNALQKDIPIEIVELNLQSVEPIAVCTNRNTGSCSRTRCYRWQVVRHCRRASSASASRRWARRTSAARSRTSRRARSRSSRTRSPARHSPSGSTSAVTRSRPSCSLTAACASSQASPTVRPSRSPRSCGRAST